MQHSPALKQFVPVLCLFLAGTFAMASGATPPATTTHHRKSGISAYGDPTKNDNADYDDPVIRQIAVGALGHANGSVLAMDPSTGRILTIVNQKMAFSRLRAVLDDQARHRSRWLAGRRDHPRHHVKGRPSPLYGPDRSDGAFQQRVFRRGRHAPRFPARSSVRAVGRPG